MGFDEIAVNPLKRRQFLARLAGVGMGLVAASAVGCGSETDDVVYTPGAPVASPFPGASPTGTFFDPVNFPGIPGQNENIVVLNYALSLEFLEADLYRQALNLASGRPGNAPLDANPASYNLAIGDGGLGANAAPGFLYLVQYSYVEAAHRDFLLQAIPTLGGTPVGPNPRGYRADFGRDLRSVLTTIRTLEEEGVRAYLGAAPFLTNFELAQLASTIYSTEARHSAAINYVLGLPIGPQRQPGDQAVIPNQPAENTLEYFRSPTQVLADIQPFLG